MSFHSISSVVLLCSVRVQDPTACWYLWAYHYHWSFDLLRRFVSVAISPPSIGPFLLQVTSLHSAKFGLFSFKNPPLTMISIFISFIFVGLEAFQVTLTFLLIFFTFLTLLAKLSSTLQIFALKWPVTLRCRLQITAKSRHQSLILLQFLFLSIHLKKLHSVGLWAHFTFFLCHSILFQAFWTCLRISFFPFLFFQIILWDHQLFWVQILIEWFLYLFCYYSPRVHRNLFAGYWPFVPKV